MTTSFTGGRTGVVLINEPLGMNSGPWISLASVTRAIQVTVVTSVASAWTGLSLVVGASVCGQVGAARALCTVPKLVAQVVTWCFLVSCDRAMIPAVLF